MEISLTTLLQSVAFHHTVGYLTFTYCVHSVSWYSDLITFGFKLHVAAVIAFT
jgi:hypothetical protein